MGTHTLTAIEYRAEYEIREFYKKNGLSNMIIEGAPYKQQFRTIQKPLQE